MYSEIQAVVGFLSSFLFNKIPRRKVNLFAEQLANFLAQKFGVCWFPAEPQRKANMRCIRVNVDSQMDPLISVAASCVGLELEEVTKHLPTELTIWVNPGEVSYRVGQCGTLMVLYAARDTSNSALNRLLSPASIGRSGSAEVAAAGQLRLSVQQQQQLLAAGVAVAAVGSAGGGGVAGMKIDEKQSSDVVQGGGSSTSGGYNRRRSGNQNGVGISSTGANFDAASIGNTLVAAASASASSTLFELSSPNDVKFTVGAFAMTRFGTTKLKSAPAAVDRVKSPKRRHNNTPTSNKRD